MRILITGGAGFIGSHLWRATNRRRPRGYLPRQIFLLVAGKTFCLYSTIIA